MGQRLVKPVRGAYDAIVYIQDGDVIAEDATGDEIDSGTAGTDDSGIIQAAINSMSNGLLYVTTPTTITLNSTVNLKKKVILQGNCAGRAYNSTDYPFWIVNTAIGLQMGDGNSINNYGYGLKDIVFRSATDLSNTAVKADRAHNISFYNISGYKLNKFIDLKACWTSNFFKVHGLANNYGMYFSADETYGTADLGVYGCSVGSAYIYDIWMEENASQNVHFEGGILENIGQYVGGCAYIGAGNSNTRFRDIYLSADGASGKYSLEDYGTETKVINCHNYGGIIYAGYKSLIDGCTLKYQSRYAVRSTDAIIRNCQLISIYRTPAISLGKERCRAIGNEIIEYRSKYGIDIESNDCVVIGNILVNIDPNDFFTDSYPIYIAPGKTSIVVTGNIFKDNINCDGLIYIPPGSDAYVRNNSGYVTEASGSSTGTGSEQTIAHGLVAAPSKVAIVPTETGATVSAVWADGTNIYCTVTTGKAYNWSAEV